MFSAENLASRRDGQESHAALLLLHRKRRRTKLEGNECTPASMPSPDDSLTAAMRLSSWMAGVLSPAGCAFSALSTPESVFSRPGGVDWCLSHLRSDLRTRIKGLKERIRHLESRNSDLRHVIRPLSERSGRYPELCVWINVLRPVIDDLPLPPDGCQPGNACLHVRIVKGASFYRGVPQHIVLPRWKDSPRQARSPLFPLLRYSLRHYSA